MMLTAVMRERDRRGRANRPRLRPLAHSCPQGLRRGVGFRLPGLPVEGLNHGGAGRVNNGLHAAAI